MTLHVSVVIPTCRRPDLLQRCLSAVLAQEYDPRKYEVIVVDDGPSNQTRLVVLKNIAARHPAIRYIASDQGPRGPAAARNLGWRAGGGTIIAFTDDDCIPSPGWLREGTASFTDGTAAVAGRIVMPSEGTLTDYEKNALQLQHKHIGFVTANCFVRKDALEEVGGFDERFTQAWREDSDLLFSLMEKGSDIVFAWNAVVTHPIRPARWGISIPQQRKNLFEALLYKKHPELYRRHMASTMIARYYLIVLLALTAFGASAAGWRGIATASLSLWVLLTGWFCAERLKGASGNAAHILEMVFTSAVIPFASVYWRFRGAWKFRNVPLGNRSVPLRFIELINSD